MPPSQKGSMITRANARPRQSLGPQVYQPTTTETVVTLDQSLDLLRVAVTASISAITWNRGVFSNECFEFRYIDKDDHITSYDAFLKGEPGWNTGGDGFAWRLLARGSDDGVDKVLNWLEVGVREALEMKYLATLQFSFYEGRIISSETLIEAYTLTFTYIDGNASIQIDSKSRTGHREGKPVMIFNAKEGMRRMMDNLYNSINAMKSSGPKLPDNRLADMHLTYTDICPKGWNAPGFKSCSDPRLVVAVPDKDRVNYANVGHHMIQVDVFSKQTADTLPDKDSSNRTAGVDEDTEVSSISSHRSQIPLSRRRQISQSSGVDGDFTQEIGVKSFKSIGVSRNSIAETQDTQALQTTVAITTQDNTWVPYSQSVLDVIGKAQIAKGVAYTPVTHDADEIQNQSPLKVTCECGISMGECNLIQCHLCDKWRHVECYGYLEKAVPDELKAYFICYTCLLPSETPLLLEMGLLCLKRRAIWFLRDEGGLKDVAVLAKYLNRGKKATKDILDELQAAGLIKELKGAQRLRVKGRIASPQYTFINDDAKLRHDYFSPQLNLTNYFDLPAALSSRNTLRGLSQMQSFSQSAQQHSARSQHRSLKAPVANSLRLSTPLEGSSTQGTPSPRTATGHVLTPDRGTSGRGIPNTPKVSTSILRRTIANKRVAELGLEEEMPSKRPKVDSTDSPLKYMNGRISAASSP